MYKWVVNVKSKGVEWRTPIMEYSNELIQEALELRSSGVFAKRVCERLVSLLHIDFGCC